MKRVTAAMAVALLFTTGGCVGNNTSTAKLPLFEGVDSQGNETTATATVELDRYGAYAVTRVAEERTKQKAIDADKAESDAKKAKAESRKVQQQTVTIKIDSAAELAEYKDLRTIEAMAQMNENMSEALIACSGKGNQKRNINFATTPAPTGVFAETVTATFDGGAKLLQTPGGVAGMVGAAVGAGIREAKKGDDSASLQVTAGGDVDMNDVANDKRVSTPGAGSLILQEIGSDKSVEVAGEGTTGTGAAAPVADGPNYETNESTDKDVTTSLL